MSTTKTDTVLELGGFIKPANVMSFKINHNDSCFTTVMRAIGKPELIEKYRGSLHFFMKSYREKLYESFGIDELDVEKYGLYEDYGRPLMRGHIIVLNNRVKEGTLFRGRFDIDNGIITESVEVGTNGHMMLCLDPTQKLFIHMKQNGTSGLLLTVDEMSLEKYAKTNPVLVDYRVIETM
jgi:hypothetical protein